METRSVLDLDPGTLKISASISQGYRGGAVAILLEDSNLQSGYDQVIANCTFRILESIEDLHFTIRPIKNAPSYVNKVCIRGRALSFTEIICKGRVLLLV